jgi:hypothetical protein
MSDAPESKSRRLRMEDVIDLRIQANSRVSLTAHLRLRLRLSDGTGAAGGSRSSLVGR